MSVPITNATATVKLITQLATANVMGNPHGTDTVSFPVFFQRKTPGEVYQRFNVELKNPAVLLCDLEHASSFLPDCEIAIDIDSTVNRAVGFPRLLNAGNDADHATVLVDFKQYGALP